MKWLFSIPVILFLALWPVASIRSSSDEITGQDTEQIALIEHSVTSGLTSAPGSSRVDSFPIINIADSIESNPDKQFPFQLYITPEDQTIQALAAQISSPEDAYQMAVQWVYVSEEKLNHDTDRWLTPHEFLASTPNYPSNPLPGKAVSDCEEQAHALVSLLRAEGTPAEEVRVVLGEVRFNNAKTGHAWVELIMNGKWVALDPCWGPYWDDRSEKLIQRRGIPFDYYVSHSFPVLQVWAYYNDIYCLDLRASTSNAPAQKAESDSGWLCPSNLSQK